jgi:hypothetical protein
MMTEWKFDFGSAGPVASDVGLSSFATVPFSFVAPGGEQSAPLDSTTARQFSGPPFTSSDAVTGSASGTRLQLALSRQRPGVRDSTTAVPVLKSVVAGALTPSLLPPIILIVYEYCLVEYGTV